MAEAENDFGDLGVVICIDLFRFARIIYISKPPTAVKFS